MRILHVSQPTSEGTAGVVSELVQLGTESGHQVTVVCPQSGNLADACADLGAQVIPTNLVRSPSVRDFAHVLRLRGLMPSFDIVHLHSSKAGALGRLAWSLTPRRRRRPLIFIPHAWSWSAGGMGRLAYRVFERWAARRVSMIVAVSEEELDEGRSTLGSAVPMVLIRNSVDTDFYVPSESGRGTRTIVCVGRLSLQKGQDRAIRALRLVQAPSVRLVLVGEGPERDGLAALAREIGVADRVSFEGTRPVLAYLQEAAVVVVPSRWEGLSLSLLEAMSTGAPIVATASGSGIALRDCGLMIDDGPEDMVVRGLARAIDGLLSDRNVAEQLGNAARIRAVQHYSLERFRREYLDLWSTVRHG